MDPIILPWVIYLVELLNKTYHMAMFINILSIMILFVIGSLYFIVASNDKERLPILKKSMKVLLVTILISTLLMILIPTRETMLTMLVLNFITPDNINLVQTNIVDFIKKIVDIINNIQ